MNENFKKKYSYLYDNLYLKKNYKNEVQKLLILIKKYHKTEFQDLSVLDYGCGTGSHIDHLKSYISKISGYDKSMQMIRLAKIKHKKNNINFYTNKKNIIQKKKKFDVIIMMFDVFSYFTQYYEIMKELSFINKILKKDGLLIFEFWYGPSVLKYKPKNYSKKIVINNKNLIKKCKSHIDLSNSIVDIEYKFLSEEKKLFLKENHKIRYFFYDEIKLFLKINNFSIQKISYIDFLNRKINASSKYSVVCCATK